MSSVQASSSSFLLLDRRRRSLGVPRSCSFSGWLNSKFSSGVRLQKIRPLRFLTFALHGGIGSSWLPSDGGASDGYGGWSVKDPLLKEANKASTNVSYVGAGVSLAVFLAAVSYCSVWGKSPRLQYTGPFLVDWVFRSMNTVLHVPTEMAESDSSNVNQAGETNQESDTGVACYDGEILEKHVSDTTPKPEVLIIPVPPDATQQEALSVLKKLKIIEQDVNPTDLCTRREYARWLVKANSFLERNPQHRISPSILSNVSSTYAFQDIGFDDPDFLYIQALAESGILLSHVSAKSFGSSDGASGEAPTILNFYPESFLSRLDLINWKAKLEYSFFAATDERMSRNKVNFIDITSVDQEEFQEFILDMQAGDKSIARKVFGYSKRFQPDKPVTKAQAAVALISGRMSDAIHVELSRLESERLSMEAESQEIRSELMLKGDIERFWEEKISQEKTRGAIVDRHLMEVMAALQEEKRDQDECWPEFLKEQAALDCQQKLLANLKVEVDDMSNMLMSEKEKFLIEQRNLEERFAESLARKEAVVEAKSVLEAEIEAVRIFRNWVEDEARRNQRRSRVLEDARRRWCAGDSREYNGSTENGVV
ncbi:uncharacterized protein LOC116264949 isoform X2 [Nymphaea colorata]|uniref:uncharacterized protein LOC116264949 isoform X2 n=1 Tax=Nymphaea colorata TaxID=210225 RepID=UPI00129E1E52|nr:uncharacterized protein LOC116264949 isoform X2 [Nymphaea colorata]